MFFLFPQYWCLLRREEEKARKILSGGYYKASILSFSIVLHVLACMHKCAHIGTHSSFVPLSSPILIRMFWLNRINLAQSDLSNKDIYYELGDHIIYHSSQETIVLYKCWSRQSTGTDAKWNSSRKTRIVMNWMFVSPPQPIHRLKFNPQCDGIWRSGFGEIIRSWWWSLYEWE